MHDLEYRLFTLSYRIRDRKLTDLEKIADKILSLASYSHLYDPMQELEKQDDRNAD